MNNERLNKLKEMERGNPTDAFIKFAIGLEYVSLHQLEKAIEQFDSLLMQFPDYLPTYYQAGKLYESLDNKAKAIDCYENGIKLAKAIGDAKTMNELKEALSLLADE